MARPKWLSLVELFAPVILSTTKLAPIAPFVAVGIKEAEALVHEDGSKPSSEEKLTHAVNITTAGIAATNAQLGKTVIDPNVADAALRDGISAVVKAVNIVHDAQAALKTS